jgi:hypothetical protein
MSGLFDKRLQQLDAKHSRAFKLESVPKKCKNKKKNVNEFEPVSKEIEELCLREKESSKKIVDAISTLDERVDSHREREIQRAIERECECEIEKWAWEIESDTDICDLEVSEVESGDLKHKTLNFERLEENIESEVKNQLFK